MKVWITKYALTSGIFTAEGRNNEGSVTSMVTVRRQGRLTEYYHGADWHQDEASALAQAEKMRVGKIASLRKRISKLENMQFKIRPHALGG